MMYLEAMSAADLIKGADSATLQRSQACSCGSYSFDIRNGVQQFLSQCAGSQNPWMQTIHRNIEEWNSIVSEDLKSKNLNWEQLKTEVPEVLDLDILIECSCPSFLYYSVWNLDQLGAAITHQPIPPSINDPTSERILCKHLCVCIRTFLI